MLTQGTSTTKMISPHLLKVEISHSICRGYHPSTAKVLAHDMWGDKPTLVIESTKKILTKWCHMVLATGPALSEEAEKSELVIIWWSEMGPDTDRVLSAIDWEKHAKNVGAVQ